MDSYIAEFPAVLLVFTGVPNITSTLIGVEVGCGSEPRSGGQRLHSH